MEISQIYIARLQKAKTRFCSVTVNTKEISKQSDPVLEIVNAENLIRGYVLDT